MIKLSLKLKPMTSIIKHQFHTDIAFACWILRFKNPAVLSFRRGIARGLDQTLFLSLRSDNLTCNPSFCFVFLGFFFFFSQTQTLQGGFVNLDIVFGCDNPTYNPFCTEIEFAYAIFMLSNPAILSCKRSIARGLDQTWFCLWGATTSHINPVFQLSSVIRLSVRHWEHMCKATVQNHKFWRHSC